MSVFLSVNGDEMTIWPLLIKKNLELAPHRFETSLLLPNSKRRIWAYHFISVKKEPKNLPQEIGLLLIL